MTSRIPPALELNDLHIFIPLPAPRNYRRPTLSRGIRIAMILCVLALVVGGLIGATWK